MPTSWYCPLLLWDTPATRQPTACRCLLSGKGLGCSADKLFCPCSLLCVLDLQPFMYGDYIAYDCWLGKVYDLKNQIILKLSNGAR